MPAMHSLRVCRLALSISVLLCTLVSAQTKPSFTSPLPTGVRLDPAGEGVDLGSLPLNLVLAPEADKAVVVLSGWREQGVQVVDLKTRRLRKHCSRMARSTAPPSRPIAIVFTSRAATPMSSLSMPGKME